MLHTLTVNLTDAVSGGDLMDIKFRSIQPVQMKSIVIILDFMMHRIKTSNETFKYIVDHAIEEINTTMQTTPGNTVECSLSLNLQGQDVETRIDNFIGHFEANTLALELCSIAPVHCLDVNDLIPYLIKANGIRYLFIISLDDAEKFNWDALIEDLFCSCRFCRNQ